MLLFLIAEVFMEQTDKNKSFTRKLLIPLVIILIILGAIYLNQATINHYEIAQALYKNGAYQKAIKKYEQAIAKGKLEEDKKWLAYHNMGSAYQELDEDLKAIECFEQANNIQDNHEETYTNMGISYRKLDQIDKAEECYNKALTLNSKYPEAFISLGTLSIFKNQPEQAIEYYQQAIEISPSSSQAHGNIALAYAMMGDFETADQELKHAIALGYENAKTIQSRINELKNQ